MHSAVKRVSLLHQVLSRIRPPPLESDYNSAAANDRVSVTTPSDSSSSCRNSVASVDGGLSWSSVPNLPGTDSSTSGNQKVVRFRSASKMDMNGEAGSGGAEGSLAAFLETLGLQSFHDAIRNELKVETVQQLKQVQEIELEDIRMLPEDRKRLIKAIKKEYPNGALGKLKKIGALNAVTRHISMKRLSRSTSESQSIRNSRSSTMSLDSPTTPAPVVGRRIIPREQIHVQEDIGEGEFGIVKHALYTNDVGQKIEVAVKSLSQDRLEHGLQEFLKEASTMQSVSHSNIVTFYGIVFQQDKELMLVTEYAPLKSLLECLHTESMRSALTVKRLCEYCSQIATGMTYLEARGLIHRDLAARNILVFSHNKVKIGDFGLSRALGLEKEYYQSKYTTDLKIPIAWCAPECITLLRFSSASDVWAFGVTMWEMFTYGQKPWDGYSSLENHDADSASDGSENREILKAIDIQNKQRLPRPELCPTEHYALMLKCWCHDPEDRPKFSAITGELSSIKPTVMKAIRDSKAAPGVIDFHEGDSITVIDKKPNDAPSWQYWKGVLSSGQAGFFNPTDCVPVQPESSPLLTRSGKPASSPKKSMKKQTSSSRSPKGQDKKRFTADMIGMPQNDFRHIGHVGYNGVIFGDVSSIGQEKEVETILHMKGGSSGSSTLRSSTSDGSSSVTGGNIIVNGDHQSSTVADHTDSPAAGPDPELDDFQFPDLSLSDSLDFGTSFIDDMMKEFRMGDKYANQNENNNSHKRSLSLHSSNSSSSTDVLPGSGLKCMSAADEKLINDAIELANQFASTSLSQANTPKEESPETPSKSKLKFSFKFPGTKKSSPKSEKKTFTDNLASRSDTTAVTPEAEQAYNLLVANGCSGNGNGTWNSSYKNQETTIRQNRSTTHQVTADSTVALPQKTRRHSSGGSRKNSNNRVSTSLDRPKERPPLPPLQLVSDGHVYIDNDLSDMPCTPPPPVPKTPTRQVPLTPSTYEPSYNNMDPFWREEMRLEYEETEALTRMHGRYKSRSDNVSYEDLMEFSEERQQVRLMQKVLGSEISDLECLKALEYTDGQTHNAIKYIKLKQLYKLRLASTELCKSALMASNWNVQHAADYILDQRHHSDDVIGV